MNRRRFLQRLMVMPVAGLGVLAPAFIQAADPVVRRRLRFILTFSNPLNIVLEHQRFWCYLPVNITPTQRLRDVRASTAYRLHDDALGHCILELSFDRFSALAQKIVIVTAEVELDAKVRPQALSDASIWLGAERFIESDDSRIRALAAELQRTTEMDTTRAIYEWVQGNIRYAGFLAEDLGALQALLERRGDCTEYADLVVALARANQIPARMMGGYVANQDLVPRPQDYHNWAEVYLEGAWRMVDAQKGNWLEPITQYITFRIYRDTVINQVGLAHRYRMQGDLQVAF